MDKKIWIISVILVVFVAFLAFSGIPQKLLESPDDVICCCHNSITGEGNYLNCGWSTRGECEPVVLDGGTTSIADNERCEKTE